MYYFCVCTSNRRHHVLSIWNLNRLHPDYFWLPDSSGTWITTVHSKPQKVITILIFFCFRNLWGHRGSFSEAISNKMSPGTPGSHSSGSSSNGSPVKAGSPPSPSSNQSLSPGSKIPTHLPLSLSQSLMFQDANKPCSRDCATTTIEVGVSPPR